MKALRRGLVAAAALSGLVAAACDQVTVVVLEPHRVEIAPDPVQLDLAGVSTLGARVYDIDGQELHGYEVDWSVVDPEVVELSGDGDLHARREGSTTVRASVGEGASGSALVEVIASRALSVVPGSFAFSAIEGSGAPLSDQAILTSTAAPIDGLQVTIDGAGSGWLDASLSSTTTDAILFVDVDPNGLSAGTYEATLTLTSPVIRSVEVPVRLSVAEEPPPTIVLAPGIVTLETTEGRTDPLTHPLSVTTEGGSVSNPVPTITYLDDTTGWLSIEMYGSATPLSGRIVATPPAGLEEGTYGATVTVAAPGALPGTLSVALVVEEGEGGAPPTIQVAPASISVTAESGGGDPAASHLEVTSSNEEISGLVASIEWGAGGSTGWLNAVLSTATTPATLDLISTIGGLAVGTYTASITIAGTDAVGATVPVTLVVTDPAAPALVVSPSTLTISAEIGGSAPAPDQIQVTSTGDEVSGLAAVIQFEGGATGWVEAALSGTTTPATLDVTADISGLASGVYSATVSVTGVGATPTSIPISLVVSEGTPTFSVNPTSVAFDAEAGETLAPIDVDITATTGTVSGLSATISYDGDTAVEWLDLSLGGTAAPTAATLVASTDGLAEGTYGADVTFSATGADDVVLPVEIVVSEAGLEIVVPTPDIELVLPLGGTLLGLVPVPVLNAGSVSIDDLYVDVQVGAGDPDWLTADVTAFAGPGSPGLLTLDAGAGMGSLAAGSYSAVVTVRSTLYGTVAAEVRVRIVVVDPGDFALAVVPGALALNATVGGGSIDGTADVHGLLPGILGVLGVVTIDAEVEYGPGGTGWLSATIADGGLSLLDPDSQVDLSADPTGLAPGAYRATVRVTGSVAGSPLLTVGDGTVQVFLHVPDGG